MKKFSLFILGILFCATNAWGQYPRTLGDGVAANGITYSFVMNPMGSPNMYAVIKTVSSNAGAITIPAVTPETTGMSMPTQQITSINSGAFSSCANLTTVIFEAANAPALSGGYAATFPNSVTTIYVPMESAKASYISAGYPEAKLAVDGASGPATSGECGDNLTWEFEDGTLTISGEGAMEDYVVASYGQPTSAPWAYYITNNLLTEVEIAGTVTTIGNYAFYNCAGLTEISLPSSLTSIGTAAFYNTSLSEIVLPSSLTDIYSGAFGNTQITNESLIRVEAITPPVLHEESEGSFPFPISSSGLTIYVPLGTVSAYQQAWGTSIGTCNITYLDVQNPCGTNLRWEYDQNTKTLTFAKIDPTVPACSMNNYQQDSDPTFASDSNSPWWRYRHAEYGYGIEYVVFPEGLTHIGNFALYNCSDLTSVTIPSTVTSIGDDAFYGCAGLRSIDLANVTTIGEEAFAACTSLISISLPSGLTSLGNSAFRTCSALTAIEIPASITNLSESAFADCYALSELTLHDGLLTIGSSAFHNCYALKSVTIPATVMSIGVQAFITEGNEETQKGCLKTLVMKNATPPTLEEQQNTYFIIFSIYPFAGEVDVYVPNGAKEAYTEAWGIVKGGAIEETQHKKCTFTYHEYGAKNDGGDINAEFYDATAAITNEQLEELAEANGGTGTEIGQFTIARPIQANGKLNTICLPFALSAAQIDNSDLAGATIYAFTAEDGVSEEKLLTLSPVTSMQAGVPYFFAYTNNAANTPNLSKLVFNDVLLTTAVEEPVDLDAGTFVLHGTLRPTRLNHETNYLFLGAENSLFYPQLEGTTEAEQTINPFRAYFEAKNGANNAPARFVFGRPMPTDIDQVPSDQVQSTKVLEDGKIVIIRNGEKYAIDGKKL